MDDIPNEPDHILVYNFDERPDLDHGPVKISLDPDDASSDTYIVSALDFSSLDADAEEDAQQVDYIDSFLLKSPITTIPSCYESPVYEFLEVIGDAEPDDMEELSPEYDSEQEGDAMTIVNEDGLFVVAESPKPGKEIDPEFQELVNSVLL